MYRWQNERFALNIHFVALERSEGLQRGLVLALALVDAILRAIWVQVPEVELRWASSLIHFRLPLFLGHLL